MKLGELIKQYREEHRYSLREFANVLAERMAKYDAGLLSPEQ